MMKVVGVIGGGAAGLCAARHVSASSCMTPIVWEKAARVGGTWVYTSQVGKDENGLPIHSSMYKNLKTNLPKELMAFPDFPFPAKEESFVHHTDVLSYLEEYTNHYNLRQYIKFRHHVEKVKPVDRDDGSNGWAVTVQDLETNTTTTSFCDSILVCNGHYSVPMMPPIKDIDKFRGQQMHSHDYREPEPFRGLRVAVLGASASGLDISLEVASVAKEVLLSHNHPVQIPSELPPNIRQVRGIVAAYEDGFVFGDGSQADADVLLCCTGYEFTFPFLSEECGVTVENNIVKPLYKHLIHTAFPTMAFVGIPFQIVPFPLFDVQVQFFLSSLKQDITLPDKTAMDQDTQAAFAEHIDKGKAVRHFHKFGKQQWGYAKDLSSLGNIISLPEVKFFLAVLTGDVTPLTHEEMDADTVHALQRLRCSGGQDRHYHRMGVEGSVRYMEELSTSAHLSPVPSYMLWFYKLVFMRMLFSLLTIKQHRYVVEAGGRVREWHNGREVNTVWNLRRLVVVQLMRLMWRDFWGVFSFATKTLRKYLGL